MVTAQKPSESAKERRRRMFPYSNKKHPPYSLKMATVVRASSVVGEAERAHTWDASVREVYPSGRSYSPDFSVNFSSFEFGTLKPNSRIH